MSDTPHQIQGQDTTLINSPRLSLLIACATTLSGLVPAIMIFWHILYYFVPRLLFYCKDFNVSVADVSISPWLLWSSTTIVLNPSAAACACACVCAVDVFLQWMYRRNAKSFTISRMVFLIALWSLCVLLVRETQNAMFSLVRAVSKSN